MYRLAAVGFDVSSDMSPQLVTNMTVPKIGIFCGVLAPVLWAVSIVACGAMRPGYNYITQYISELGERGCSTEVLMRYGAFIPTGLMYVVFAGIFAGLFRESWSVAIAAALIGVSGLARIGAGIFPCDAGCGGRIDFTQPAIAQPLCKRGLRHDHCRSNPLGYRLQTLPRARRVGQLFCRLWRSRSNVADADGMECRTGVGERVVGMSRFRGLVPMGVHLRSPHIPH